MTTYTYQAVTLNGVKGYIATRRIGGVHAGKQFGKTQKAAREAFDWGSMTAAQFIALAQLLRMRGGLAQETVRLVLVDGLPVAAAAKATGLDPRLAHRAVKSARAGVDLALIAAGYQRQSSISS